MLRKRIISLCLVIQMLISTLPLSVRADTADPSVVMENAVLPAVEETLLSESEKKEDVITDQDTITEVAERKSRSAGQTKSGLIYAPYTGVDFMNANISSQRKAALTKAMQMVQILWTCPADFPTW